MALFLTMTQTSSDFAEIWYTKVFEGAESKNDIKILVRPFFLPKKIYVFWGCVPQKMTKTKSCPILMKFRTRGFSRVLISKMVPVFTWNHFFGVYS